VRKTKICDVLIIGLITAIIVVLFWQPVEQVYGLGQRDAVIKIRAIAADMNLTPAQCENLTKQQAYNYLTNQYPALPTDKLKEFVRYWPAIKIMLTRDAEARERKIIRSRLKQVIATEWPNADIDWSHWRVQEVADQVVYLIQGGDPNAL